MRNNMLENTTRKGRQSGRDISLGPGSQDARGAPLPRHPFSTSDFDQIYQRGWGAAGQVPARPHLPLAEAQQQGPPPRLLCVYTRNTGTAVLPSFRLKTFCIEKISAHLVSSLLLLASARTICGIKRHALMDRREKG